ncbi:MAG TPA: hypothetical protein VMT16_16315 [Thermoanaerobaculia bacterium]|nr:hypothetical protein [Thermoanaerobaculia bacterium]
MNDDAPIGKAPKGKPEGAGQRPLALAAIGLEAELELWVDGVRRRPEDVFGTPRAFLRGRPMHRAGTSYHLPTGGAVYFDTGVIEVATPVIEVARGCAARAGRSLWESILHLRDEIDVWERREGRRVALAGFSTHYTTSFGHRPAPAGVQPAMERMACLLVHLLAAPVALLACNRRSTGVGVRPRGDRIEVTVDFTPSPALMIATGTLIAAVVGAVARWPAHRLDGLAERGIPVIAGLRPIPHTSRRGWLARDHSFPANPFTADPDAAIWPVDAKTRGVRGPLSLRQLARAVLRHFHRPIRRLADPFTYRLLLQVLGGRAPSLLDLPERPPAYEDVGRLCFWDNLFPEAELARSRYERVLIRAIGGHLLQLEGDLLLPVGMRGWTTVLFRRQRDGARISLPLDFLALRLDDWERARQAGVPPAPPGRQRNRLRDRPARRPRG